MRRALVATTVAVCLCAVEVADAQWVKFANETATRLTAATGLGSANPDEKSFAWGDLDQDGDTDLVVVMKQAFTTRGRRRNLLLMNQGGILTDRTDDYADTSDYPGSVGFIDQTNDRDVVIADFNGDGWLDLATAVTLSGVLSGGQYSSPPGDHWFSHPRIYINMGNDAQGNWQGLKFEFYYNGDTNQRRFPAMPSEPRFCSISAGDIDNDGDLDLYLGDYQQPESQARTVDLNDRLLINNGNGVFTDESAARMTVTMLESSFAMSTFFADANNDGFLDIFKDDALNAPQAISVSYNNPENPGFFNNYQLAYQVTAYEVFVGDLNNDNRLDFIVSDDVQDRYVINNGNNAQGLATWTNYPFTYQVGGDDGFGGDSWIGDLNNDGLKDAIITDVDVDLGSCTENRRTHIFRNLGTGPAGMLREDQSGGRVCDIPVADLRFTHDVAVFDIDQDGWKDMILGRCGGLRVYRQVPPTGIQFTYPLGQPGFVQPNAVANFTVQVAPIGVGTIQPGSGTMYLSVNGGAFTPTAMSEGPANVYQASLPAGNCADRYEFYFTAQIQGGSTFTDPSGAPTAVYSTIVASGEEEMMQEGFEGDTSAWTVSSDPSLTGGAWEVADPNVTIFAGLIAAPEDDASQDVTQVMAFVTENGLPGGSHQAADVDGGPTHLISPMIDLAGTDATITFARWFFTSNNLNRLIVSVSNNDGGSWTEVLNLAHDTTQSGSWQNESFRVGDYIVPSAQIRVRISVSDNNSAVTEAGIDSFRVTKLVCTPPACGCLADMNTDLARNALDIQGFVDCYLGSGANCACADVNGGGLDATDIPAFVTEVLNTNNCP